VQRDWGFEASVRVAEAYVAEKRDSGDHRAMTHAIGYTAASRQNGFRMAQISGDERVICRYATIQYAQAWAALRRAGRSRKIATGCGFDRSKVQSWSRREFDFRNGI
jgi:hypothetical protein